MKNLKTYYVPVKCTLTSTLAIDAINQTEAIKQVTAIMEKNADSLTQRYDSALIMYSDITCKQDDEMLDEMAKDLNIKPEVVDNPVISSILDEPTQNKHELYTNTVTKSISEESPKAINDIVIYTGTDCPWCHKTMSYLNSKHLLFVEKNINTNPQFKGEMLSMTRQSSLPALIINGKVVLGFDKKQIEGALNV